ncbi:hypothetical protein [Nocardioides rubriscoriae]|uniref:hypothetical protein n=1 Tax=Nocardioides rubriscoriae TaxID=642762 RepID=UPI0011E0514E|nr:hypothetical protein [Nocardioides rubriscoriae]
MDMRMTESAAWMVGLMAFLVLMTGAVLVAVRIYGGRAAHDDHPHDPVAVQRALVARIAQPAVAAVAAAPAAAAPSALQRGGDAVEDVGLRDDQ